MGLKARQGIYWRRVSIHWRNRFCILVL